MISTTPNPPIPDWAQFQVSLSDHPVITDPDGILRYQAKPITRWLRHQVNLTTMQGAYNAGYFSRQQFMQFYREIGYSLTGFQEIWGEVLDEMENQTTTCPDCSATIPNDGICWYCENHPSKSTE